MALVTAANRTEVAQLYVALFGRAPLSEGLGFYSQKVASGMPIPEVAQEMYNLDVARPYYPLEATATQIVTSFFTNVLGRTPEAGGLSYWVGRLNAANAVNPATAEGTVIAEMIDSVVAYSGTNAVALNAQTLFNKKVAVALAFRDEQASNPEGGHPYGLTDAALLGVSDDLIRSVTVSSDVSNPGAYVETFLNNYFGRTLTVSAQDAVEGQGNVVYKLELSAAPAEPITITVSTGAADDTATKGSDYTAVSQQITFAAGQTVQYVTVNVNDDALVESAENVTLNVSGPVHVTVTGDRVAQITSDDIANRPPVPQSASAAAEEGGDVVAGSVVATDADGDALTYAVVGTVPAGLTFNANGSYSFNPKVAAYNSLAEGAVDTKTVTYAVSDGNGHTVNGTLTITITGTNDAPVAQAVIARGLEDAAIIEVAPASSDVDSADTAAYTVNTQPANGTVAFNPLTGNFEYTPKGDFHGLDSFTYRVTDSQGATSVATATVSVDAVNDAPIAKNASGFALEAGFMLYGTVSATDIDSTGLTYTLNGTAPAGLTFNAAGGYSFDPTDSAYDNLAAGQTLVLTLPFTAHDNHPTDPKTSVGNLVISVLGTNDDPVARAVIASGAEDAAVIPVAVNIGSDVTDVDAGDTHVLAVNTQPANGTVVLNADGDGFDYVPNKDFNGTDTFSYRVTDNNGGTAVNTVTVRVASVNDAPVAQAGAASTAEAGSMVYGAVRATDVDSANVTYALNGAAPAGLTFAADGVYAFDPADPAYDYLAAGQSLTITVPFTANDNHPTDPKTSSANLVITVTGTNDGPVAQAVAGSGNEDTAIMVAADASDLDDTDTHVFSVAVNPANGVVEVLDAATGQFKYTPNADFNGIDTFTYRVTDNNGASHTAVATVTVAAVNDAPDANPTVLPDAARGRAYKIYDAALLANASDVDGDTLTVTSVTVDASKGTVTRDLNPDGSSAGTWTYTPAAGLAIGTAVQLGVTISDGTVAVNTYATTVIGESVFNLTSRVDIETGYKVYNSMPGYTPGGDDLVNTLQDEDDLTGTGADDDRLNVTLGSVNDNAETLVGPKLSSIEIVNVEVTGGQDEPVGIDFQNTDGVRELHVNRVTASNATVMFQTLHDTTTELSVTNAVRNGSIWFNYGEGEWSGVNDTLHLDLNNVQQNTIAITAGDTSIFLGGDFFEDEGYGPETVEVHVTGSTNVDQLIITPNWEEQNDSILALLQPPSPGVMPFVDQTINFVADASLEINQLWAPGAEFVNIEANANVKITGNERTNFDGLTNRGLDHDNAEDVFWTPELRAMEITGAGNVWLNGVSSSAGGVEFPVSNHAVVIDGSTMTGNLAIRLLDDVAGESDDINVDGGVGSTVDSGSGKDEVVTTTDTYAAITTRDDDDVVRIGHEHDHSQPPAPEDHADLYAPVSTGQGADQVIVQGDINADIDTHSAVDAGEGALSDDDTDGDMVSGEDLNAGADIETGRGADSVVLRGSITGASTIDTAEGDDNVSVAGSQAAGAHVTTGQGDDRVSFGQGTNGTIDTGIDDDVVTIGGNATSAISATTGLVTDSGINLDTGSDSLTIVGTLGTKVTAGSADETGNANGKDSVSVGGDMLGTASITTMAGDDTVFIGGNLRTAYEDDASIAGRTTEANPGQNNPGKGAVKTGAAADIDKTVAADIDTGEGNDSVEAGTLESAVQWNDNIIPNNINADDTIHVVGATIALGNGDDHLQLGLRLAAPVQTHNSPILQEQTLVDAGGGHDHVRVNFNGSVVMAADNSSFLDDYIDHEQTLGAINRNGTQDTLGAKIALGSGDDHLLFTDVGFDDAVGANYDAGMPGAPTALSDDVFDGVALIVDSGAVVDGGADDDILEVRTVDRVDVVKSEEYWYDSVSGAVVQGDADSLGNTDLRKDEANGQGGHILGVEQIDLVIANQVTSATDTNGRITDSTGDQSPYPDRPVGLLDQTVTDNEESSWVSGGDSPMIRLDVHQVDDDLEVVNLQSFEARQELEDTDEYTVDSNADNELDTVYREIDNGFMAGQTTMFEVDNLRSDVELNLQAYEVNALDETQRTDFRGNKLDGVDDGEGFNLTDNCEIDVTVAVNMDARPGPHDSNRSFTLNMLAHESLATGDLTDNNYDLRLISQDEFTNAATTPRPGLQHQLGHYARDVELNVETGGSHHINFSNAFGTVTDSVYDVRNQNGVSQGTIEANDTTATVVGSATQDALDSVGAEVEREFGTTFWQTGGVGAPTDYGWTAVRTGDVRTSLTVNGGDAGETLLISGIHADNITVTGDDNTFVVVDQQNQYRISTGNGDDLIDLRADTFVNDSIEGGADHDTLVINAGDGITGSEFNAVNGIEDLVVVALEGEDSTTSLDVDPSDLERIVLVTTNRDGSMPGFDDSDDLDMESGEVGHQVVNVSANLGAGKLVVDADTEFLDFRPDFCPADNTTNRHSDRLTLTIDTAGVTNTDIDVYVNVAEGTKLAVNNNVNEQYNVFVTISSLANTHINDNEIDQPWMYEYNAGGDEEGELQLTTIDNPLPAIPGPGASAGSSIDQLWLLDSSRDVSGTDLTTGSAGHNVFVKVEDSWANASANTGLFGADLIIHAADINDTDESVFNVRNEIDGSAETSASLLIIGTQDNDDINGGDANDTLVGESGNDLLYGGKGADWLEGGVGSDQLAGDYDGSAFEIFPIGGRDTLVGGAGADLIYGGVGADSLVGGADGDVFVYTRRADSAGVLSNTDTLADFDPTVDRIDVRYLAFDPALQNVVGGYFDGDQNKYIGGGSLFGREMVFGRIVPTDTQLGGNTVNYADATAAAHQGNGIIEVIYQRDEGVLWFDLNDDGSLDNNDLRIRLPYGTKVDGLYSELPVDSGSPTWLLGVNDASFFDYIRTSEFGTAGLPQFGGTVVNDHIIVDTVSTLPEIDNDTGLDEPRGLATYGGHDEILVRTNSDFWIDAGDGNDVVDGSDGNETIIGGDGDDSVLAGEGDDSVLGGNGDDTVDGEAGDDYVLATPGDDSILGGEGDDTLYGGIEDDTIRGEQGEDLIISGNETPYVLDGNALTDDDLVEGGSGNDTISTGQGEDWVDGGTEDDRISTGSGDDTAYGDSGADVIEASDGNDDVYGGAGNDSVDAGAGADWVEGNGDDDILIGREGNDTVTGGDGEDYVNGGDDADQLFGNLDEDTMIGGDGADWMDGGSDSDLMMGNAGDDSMYGADGEDWVEGNEGSDLIEGGEGNDILSGGNLLEIFGPLMAESPLAPVILFPQIDFDGLLGDLDGKDTIHGQGGEDIAFGGGNDDIVTGGEGEDALYGDAPGLLEFINLMQNGSGDPDTLEALVSGDDSIEGNEGEDYIEGGFGHDTILGGTENDELFGDWGLSLNLGVGPSVIIPISDADTVFDALGHADSMLGGTGSDRMYGQGGDDTMFGGDNDEDVIDGSDIMYGGAGNDRMNGELGDDYMDGGDGNDTMLGSAPTNSISDDDIMFGEDGDDLMYGYDGSDGMSGGNGDDTMYGGDENDYMEGGSDSDVMHGEEGNDSMAGGNAAALWTPLTAFAIDPDGYSDATSDDYVIADLGDDSDDDTMTGGEGNDTVVGMADDDSLSGGNGDDLLFGDYIGEDVLNYFRGGLVSDDTVWTLWDGQDVISGGNGNDDIWGGFGNDTIDGDAGADWIQGDYGDETRKFVYIGDSNPPAPSSDDLLDFGAEGNDDLIYGGTGNDTIDGNQGDDWIDGEQDDDSLFGSDGDDTLIGGTGRDFIDGGSDDDSILGGDGNDTVYGDDGADFVDGGSDDDSINGGDGDDTLLGGADDGFDDIFGSDGSDSIVGGGGNDDLAGGEGNDTIYGDAGDDAINGGSDDDALFGGAGNDDMVGSDGDDWLDGGSGDDDMEGSDGDDTMFGADGNDDMYGGSDDDWLFGDETFSGQAPSPEAPLPAGPWTNTDDHIHGDEGADSIFGGVGDDSIDLSDDGFSSDDEEQTDWLHLSVDTTTETQDPTDSLFGALGNDTIDNFDTTDVDGNDGNNDGDWLVLLKGDVSNGSEPTQSVVMVTDWSNDVVFLHSDETGLGETMITFDPDEDPGFDTVGQSGVSIADASLVIVKTAFETDDSEFADDWSFEATFDSSDANEMSDGNNDFEFRYDTAEGVDEFLEAQNGTFNGSVFVITDDANNSGNVYLWWDADAADENDGNGEIDTVLVGTFTSQQNAEDFFDNIKWVDSFGFTA